ncbi:hypothetical protein N7499_002482, partial [Penicillium canescens]
IKRERIFEFLLVTRTIINKKIGEDSEDTNLEARVIAAYYKYFELTIETIDSIIMLILTYKREFVKGY